MADGEIIIDSKISLTNLNKSLKDMNTQIQKFGNGAGGTTTKTSSAFLKLGNVVKFVAGTLVAKAVGQFAKAGIQYNAEMQKYETALTTITKSADKTDKIMSQLKKDALATPFDVQGLAQGNQLLMSAGVSAKDAREDMLALGNAVVASGGGNEELQRMAFNLQQVKTQGKATSIDVRQFAVAGINIYKLLADSTGKTVKQVKDMDVTYEMLSKALRHAREEGGAYHNAIENSSKNFNVAASNAKAGVSQLAGAVMKVPFEKFSDMLAKSSIKLGELTTATEKDGVKGFAKAGGKMILEMANGFISNLPTLTQNAVTGLLTFAENLVSKVPTVFTLGANMIENIGTGLINSLPLLIEKVPKIINTLADNIYTGALKLAVVGGKLIIRLGVGIIKSIPLIVKNAGEIVKAIFNVFTLANFFSAGKKIIENLFTGAEKNQAKIPNLIKKIGTKAKNFFTNINWKSVGKKVIDFINTGLKGSLKALLNVMKNIATKALNVFKPSVWVNKGKDLISNIIKGLLGSGGKFYNAVKELFENTFNLKKLIGGGNNKNAGAKQQAKKSTLSSTALENIEKANFEQYLKQVKLFGYSNKYSMNINSKIDYDKLGNVVATAVVEALINGNISIEINKRKIGRLI